MKKIIAISMALSCLSTSFAADDRVLVLSTDGTYPPFSEMGADGEMTGFDIDIGYALCEEMQVVCEFKQIEWDGLIPALKTGKIDAIVASMNANDERRKSVAFSEPYYGNPGVFVRHRDATFDFSQEDLEGKVLGVLRASIFDDYASNELADWGITIQRYNSQEEANLDLQNGRVDALFADKIVLQDGFLSREGGQDFVEFGPELDDEEYFGEGISIAVRLDEQALADRFSKAIKDIRENGVYQEINDKYFSYDIYDVIANPPAKP